MRLVSTLQRSAGLAVACAAFAAGAQAQTLGCEVGAANGGLVPLSGTGGGGTFPTTLPTSVSLYPLTVTSLPPGATVVTEVKLLGLTHSWINDVHFVLEDPAGGRHNLFVRRVGSCDFNGNYSIVPACTGALAYPATCSGATILANGAYDQFFGTWPSGTNGILNTPLDTLGAATGTWNLIAMDWASGDAGALTSWDLCFGNPVPPTAPTAAPVLSAPANAAVATNPVTLTWAAVTCAATYDVDLDGVVTNVASTSFAAPVLAPGTHTWTVRAVNASGMGPYAASRTFDIPLPPPPSVCVAGGAAGLVPASGTGGTGATWPTVLPATPYQNSYLVNVPTGASQIVKVELAFGTQHTFVGDLQVVLTDPTGGMHNVLHRFGFTTTGFGSGCDLNGTYSFYQSAGQSLPSTCPGSGDVLPGDYMQSFGTWTSGDLGIFNTPLGSIPVASGLWTLTVYDWGAGDAGALTGWQVCFDDNGGLPTFCVPQAPGTTNGCIPTINATANPDVAHSNTCVLTISDVEGDRSGLVLYGVNGQVNVPWCVGGNSFRCIVNPVQRLGVQNSGGTPGLCDGVMVQDWNAYQLANPSALGNPFGAGDTVDVQGWFRDPSACKNSFMSQGVRLTYTP
jgi:subtilisin-like proprotein convertase family protein